MRAALIAALACLAAGCSVVLDYPAPTAESTADLCTGGRDDDQDGLVDCDDPDCVRYCPEWSRAACQNGRDDDDDSLLDLADPSCWPRARVEVDRSCMRIAGTEIDETAWDHMALTVSPAVRDAPDAAGHRVITFPGEAIGWVQSDGLLTGDLGRVEVELELDVVPGRWFEVGLLFEGREAALRAGSAEGLGVLVVPSPDDPQLGELSVTIDSARAALQGRPPRVTGARPVRAPERIHLTLRTQTDLRGRAVLESVDVDGSTYQVSTADGTLDYVGVDVGVRLYARAELARVGDDVAFRLVRVTRAPIDRCAVATPGSESQPAIAHRVLSALEVAGGRVCAIVATEAPEWGTSRLDRLVSDDCGRTGWRTVGEPLTDVARVSTAALARTPDGHVATVVGMAAFDRLAANRLERIAWMTDLGADCTGAWTLDGREIDAMVATRVSVSDPRQNGAQERRAGVLGLWVDPGGRRHVTVVDRDDTTPIEITTMDLVTTTPPVIRTLDPLDLDAILGVGIGTLRGNAVWAARVDDGSIALVVEGEGGMTGRIPLFTPGEPPGSFDQAGGAFPTFVPFDPDGPCAVDDVRGLLIEGALPADPADTAYPTGVFPVRVRAAAMPATR